MKPKITLRHKIVSTMPYLFLRFLIKQKILNLVINEQIRFFKRYDYVTVNNFWTRITLRTQLIHRFPIYDAKTSYTFWKIMDIEWENYLRKHETRNKIRERSTRK